MNQNLIIQYTIVGIIIILALIWIIVKTFKRKGKKSSGCSCCPLHEACPPEKKKRKSE